MTSADVPPVAEPAQCLQGCVSRGLSRCFCQPVKKTAAPTPTCPQLNAKQGSLPAPKLFAGPASAEVQQARQEAANGRDLMKDGQALVNHWREASKPRKGGAIAPKPAGCKLDFPDLFARWLEQRGLSDKLVKDEDKQGWSVYRYVKTPVVEAQPHWEVAFHGTWWYAVWLILESGILLESNNRQLGHDFWEPGVYCSPNLDTGLWYARPQILFGDGVFHRVIFELRVDPAERQKNRQRGGVQWVFPGSAVAVHAVWVRSNAPPANGEERVNDWQPELEALPSGWSYPEKLVNDRKGPWPHHVDPFAWDISGNNVPPWMRDPSVKTTNVPSAVPVVPKAAAATPDEWTAPAKKKKKNGRSDYGGKGSSQTAAWWEWPGQGANGWSGVCAEPWALDDASWNQSAIMPKGSLAASQQSLWAAAMGSQGIPGCWAAAELAAAGQASWGTSWGGKGVLMTGPQNWGAQWAQAPQAKRRCL